MQGDLAHQSEPRLWSLSVSEVSFPGPLSLPDTFDGDKKRKERNGPPTTWQAVPTMRNAFLLSLQYHPTLPVVILWLHAPGPPGEG